MCGSLFKNDTYECCGGAYHAQTIHTCKNQKCAGGLGHGTICKKPFHECPKTCAIIRTPDVYAVPRVLKGVCTDCITKLLRTYGAA